MKKSNVNITNNTIVEAYGNHTKRNAKKVYIVEKNMVCTSVTDAAEVIGCSLDAVSNVIRGKQKTCYGYHVIDLSKAGETFPQMVACLSETHMPRPKGIGHNVSREEWDEFRKWKAERKAEEKAKVRKEKHEAKKAKLQADIERHQLLADKANAKWAKETNKVVMLERKLEALLDKEVM